MSANALDNSHVDGDSGIPEGSARSDYFFGMACSAVLHVVLLYLMLGISGSNARQFEEVIYSVTIEGGKSLGGIQQVPKEDKPVVKAVPRNVSDPKTDPQVKPDISEEKVKETTPEKDSEVSLATPVPTSAPTVQPTRAPTARATSAPTKKPTPKQTATPRAPTKAELNREYQATMQKYLGESTRAGGKGFGAAAQTGGSGMGGGVLRPPEFFRYRDLLEAFVKSGWRWIDPQSRLSASVVFNIAPDGTVSGVRIDRSSGNREFDDSVLRAVYKANPVPKPPPSVYEEYFQTVRMIFEPQ